MGLVEFPFIEEEYLEKAQKIMNREVEFIEPRAYSWEDKFLRSIVSNLTIGEALGLIETLLYDWDTLFTEDNLRGISNYSLKINGKDFVCVKDALIYIHQNNKLLEVLHDVIIMMKGLTRLREEEMDLFIHGYAKLLKENFVKIQED